MAAPTESDLEITSYHFQMKREGGRWITTITATCRHKTEKWTGLIKFADREIAVDKLGAAKKQLLENLDAAIQAKVKAICAKKAADAQAGRQFDETPIDDL